MKRSRLNIARWSFVLLFVAALAWICWYGVVRHDGRGKPTADAGPDNVAATTEQSDVTDEHQPEYQALSKFAGTSTSTRPESVPSDAELARMVYSEYQCRDCSSDSPFAAQSPADAAWMQFKGFPTHDQLANMESLDQVALKSKADRGDLVAMGLYGTVLLKEGLVDDALFYLDKAKLRGSIYALYALAKANLFSNDVMNRDVAAANIRVAYLLGDNRAAAYLYATYPNLSIDELITIDGDASLYFSRLRMDQIKKFGAPVRIVPRPHTN